MLSEQEILRYVGQQPKHTAGFKQFIHDLGLKGRARRELQELLKEMTRRRKLVAIGKERWSLPTSSSTHNLVVGRLHTHRDGYGFVTPDPDSLPVRAQGKVLGDIFIPPPESADAMHGDRVLVELGSIRHDGRAEGRIVRVTEREQETVVGIFHYGPRHNFVTPIDAKVAVEIVIPHGMEYPDREGKDQEDQEDEVDEKTPSSSSSKDQKPHPPSPAKTAQGSPHRVLGSEVKRANWDDLENVVVEVEIVQWPSANQNPRGRVLEILGYEDDFGVDVEMVIRKHHIPHFFSSEVLEE